MKKLFWFLFLVTPILIVFHAFFKPGTLAWGDAPHFYSEELRSLIAEPLTWTNRGIALGGLNYIIWISPLTIIYGILGNILKLGNDIAIRIVFYFPAVILSALGAYLLGKKIGGSKSVGFFTSFIYVLNTYFILVVDGGQVGIALAYGLFPFVITSLKKLVDDHTFKNYLVAIIFLFLCSIADPRIAIIGGLTAFVWIFFEILEKRNIRLFKNLIYLILAGINVVFLSGYWVVPLLFNKAGNQVSNLASTSVKLIDAFVLFSPHWPSNVFGEVGSPPVYFLFIPVLILVPFLVGILKRKREILSLLPLLICYLAFGLVSAGVSYLSKIPFGFAFRDTSKFFIPVILFAGIIIGIGVKLVNKKVFTGLVYLYLLILVAPALFGKMNFVLSDRVSDDNYQKIYNFLKTDDGARTLWIPERHPLAFDTQNEPAVDGNSLINFFPFAMNNKGEDPFNFVNSEKFSEWLGIFGIRYIVLPDDQRTIVKSTEQKNNWHNLLELVSKTEGLEKQDLGVGVPVYKNTTIVYPHIFGVKKMYGLVGKPLNNPSIPVFNFEDGKFDPNLIKSFNPDSFGLIFNGGDINDLQMSLLGKYLSPAWKNSRSDWAVYKGESYLKYKYELLIRNLEFNDFDYLGGISFSTKVGEKIDFDFTVEEPGEYVFAMRSWEVDGKQSSLNWKFENLKIDSSTYKKTIENKHDISILNMVALIPKKEFDKAGVEATDMIKKFGIVNASSITDKKMDYAPIDIKSVDTLKFGFLRPAGINWIIFSDNFNKLWKIKEGNKFSDPYPAYSTINSFYLESGNNFEIVFKGQENFRIGLVISITSEIILIGVYTWRKLKQH